MPIPVSSTVTVSSAPCAVRAWHATSTKTCPRDVNFTALLTRLRSTCRIRPGSPITWRGTSGATRRTRSSPFASTAAITRSPTSSTASGRSKGTGSSSATKTVTVSASGSSPTSSVTIAKAPNFSAADLSALPNADWPTVGGSLMNERYSPLDQIDTSNVSQLKGVWRTHLGSGLAAKYSAEGQPVVYKGVIYITTGEDDTYAVSVATGKILWRYTSGISQEISTICCGWDNRGVAIGDGRVYLGQLDGTVVALDQQTGKVLWKKRLVRWQLGQTITAAPIYVDGRIYIGVVGAEYGTRAFLQALDASTGEPVWRWYSTASPGQPGGKSWPEVLPKMQKWLAKGDKRVE